MNKYVWTSKIYVCVALVSAALLGIWVTFFYSAHYQTGAEVLRLSANPRQAGIRIYDGRVLEQTFSLPEAANRVGVKVMAKKGWLDQGRLIIQILEGDSEPSISTVVPLQAFISGQNVWVQFPHALTPGTVYRLRISTEEISSDNHLEIPADYERDSSYKEGLIVLRDIIHNTELIHRQGNIALHFKYFFSRKERFLLR